MCVLIYGGCLVSSLVCAVADTGIANGYGSQDEKWYASNLAEGIIRPDVSYICMYVCMYIRYTSYAKPQS